MIIGTTSLTRRLIFVNMIAWFIYFIYKSLQNVVSHVLPLESFFTPLFFQFHSRYQRGRKTDLGERCDYRYLPIKFILHHQSNWSMLSLLSKAQNLPDLKYPVSWSLFSRHIFYSTPLEVSYRGTQKSVCDFICRIFFLNSYSFFVDGLFLVFSVIF